MLNSFFVQLFRLVRYLSFAECIIVFREIRGVMKLGGVEYTEVTTVEKCKQECVESFEYCGAVDFVDGKCFMHEKDNFEAKEAVRRTGSTQYVAKPCKDR